MYQSHLYRLLAQDNRIKLTVLFASNAGVRAYHDTGFGGRNLSWDTDLTSGYAHRFLMNADRNGVEKFFDQLDWDLLPEITRERCDVLWVHGYSFATLWLGIVAAKLRGIPVMIREEQTLLHERPWWKASVRSLTLRALFFRSTALAIGSNNHAFFQRYGVPTNRIFLVPYTTDNVAWQHNATSLTSSSTDLIGSFGLPPDVPVVLFVGKLQPKKQPDVLVEAFRRVRKVMPCALLLVGTGPLESELRRAVAEQSIPDVVFASFLNRTEISRAYAAADIFVLPSSLNETWGMVVNEAMNFGLPVIVSDKVGCAPDLVTHGVNGYVFDHHDVQALTSLLANLIGDSALRERFGRRSRERITLWSPQLAVEGLVRAAERATQNLVLDASRT